MEQTKRAKLCSDLLQSSNRELVIDDDDDDGEDNF